MAAVTTTLFVIGLARLIILSGSTPQNQRESDKIVSTGHNNSPTDDPSNSSGGQLSRDPIREPLLFPDSETETESEADTDPERGTNTEPPTIIHH